MAEQADTNASLQVRPEEYYSSLQWPSLSDFQNFDDESVYRSFLERAANANSRNFILDFSADHAWGAFDQCEPTFEKLVKSPRPESLATRWINIWGPDQQTEIVTSLAHHYEFSPRLTALMASVPRSKKKPTRPGSLHSKRQSASLKSKRSTGSFRSAKFAKSKLARIAADPEKGASGTGSSAFGVREADVLHHLNHYDVVDALWHWSSVDIGEKYVCLGFNSIYNVDTSKLPGEVMDPKQDIPQGDRFWSWLILTCDRTVIHITEGLGPDFDYSSPDASNTRRNLLNVFAQLSTAVDSHSRNPISLVPLRSAALEFATAEPTDETGLLFYYLFDDWHTSYSLIAKRDEQYRGELFRLRESMMARANLSHINQLDHLGQQLAVLKRLYMSYELIITRVLEKQRLPRNNRNFSCPSERAETQVTATPFGSTYDSLGIFLTSGVRIRFERLRDRIRLYALSEIEECCSIRESLVMVNFNLISIRESDAVERLTRITILLAKVTILFLPVSLMTAYFSTQLEDNTTFTIQTYWISFAVIFALSWLGLWVFGKISGTVETAMVYRPLNQVIAGMLRDMVRTDRPKEE